MARVLEKIHQFSGSGRTSDRIKEKKLKKLHDFISVNQSTPVIISSLKQTSLDNERPLIIEKDSEVSSQSENKLVSLRNGDQFDPCSLQWLGTESVSKFRLTSKDSQKNNLQPTNVQTSNTIPQSTSYCGPESTKSSTSKVSKDDGYVIVSRKRMENFCKIIKCSICGTEGMLVILPESYAKQDSYISVSYISNSTSYVDNGVLILCSNPVCRKVLYQSNVPRSQNNLKLVSIVPVTSEIAGPHVSETSVPQDIGTSAIPEINTAHICQAKPIPSSQVNVTAVPQANACVAHVTPDLGYDHSFSLSGSTPAVSDNDISVPSNVVVSQIVTSSLQSSVQDGEIEIIPTASQFGFVNTQPQRIIASSQATDDDVTVISEVDAVTSIVQHTVGNAQNHYFIADDIQNKNTGNPSSTHDKICGLDPLFCDNDDIAMCTDEISEINNEWDDIDSGMPTVIMLPGNKCINTTSEREEYMKLEKKSLTMKKLANETGEDMIQKEGYVKYSLEKHKCVNIKKNIRKKSSKQNLIHNLQGKIALKKFLVAKSLANSEVTSVNIPIEKEDLDPSAEQVDFNVRNGKNNYFSTKNISIREDIDSSGYSADEYDSCELIVNGLSVDESIKDDELIVNGLSVDESIKDEIFSTDFNYDL